MEWNCFQFCDISFALQVKYKGKKLDAYKNTWFKKRKQDQNKEIEVSDGKLIRYIFFIPMHFVFFNI
jgi:hypothetical protein